MPAERTQRPRHNKGKGKGNARAGPSEPKKHTVPSLEARDGLMGVSKLKGQIRQTRRLLAKDTLEPGLRVATQRRLTSLEADLAKAEQRTVEKKNGQKYHAVKFFERQKLVRIIKRAAREENAEQLAEARVMLNYIIHFPNTQKYIALFPPETKANADTLTLPAYLHEEPAAGPATTRLEILREMQRLMAEGKIGGEPETERAERAPADRRGVAFAAGVQVEVGSKKDEGKEKAEAEVEEEDDFFGDE